MEYRVRGYAGPRQTMLVVDDNEVQRELIRELLAPLGFVVVGAASGRECLALVEQINPNLILLDIAMPEMDGWEVAQRLRRQPGKRPAILMLSANAIDAHHMLEAERLYDDTLMKPIDVRQLLKKIHALRRYRMALRDRGAGAAASGSGRDGQPHRAAGRRRHRRTDPARRNRPRHADHGEARARSNAGSPECGEFVILMRTMVNAFDFKRYASALQEVRGAHA